MRKSVLTTIVMVIGLMVVTAVTVGASSTEIGPYEGVFVGTVYGDGGSSAPITLELTHRGDDVEGTVEIGSGLYVNGRNCGSGYMPATVETAVGETGRNPNHLTADAAFRVSGISVNLDLTGALSADGDDLAVEAKIDLPWLCGRDPVITGDLVRK